MPASPEDEAKEGEAFLSRWSRRKQTLPAEMVVEEPEEEALPVDPGEEMTDEELLVELDLPDPDTMKDSDDFSAFMKARVPERLRRRALRTLWRSNPVLANLDELVDYGEDYTDAATVVENMQTVYEVGKGAAEKWKRHMAALAAAAEEEGEADAPEPSPVSEATQKPETAPEATAPEAMQSESTDGHATALQAAEASPPPPRHMRFRFD